MPARVKKIFHDEDTRQKIQVGNIITRLHKHINGEIELSATQIAAAKLLLDKTLPNLTSVDVKEEKTTTYVLRAPSPAKDAAEWLNQYGPRTIEHAPAKPNGKANGSAN